MAGILWLSSYPKSGNTWLRAYLANLFRNPARPIPIDDLPSHVKSWTRAPDPRLCVMRYEDMPAKPFKTFSALSGFLGLPVEPERVKKAIRFSVFRELKSQEDETGEPRI